MERPQGLRTLRRKVAGAAVMAACAAALPVTAQVQDAADERLEEIVVTSSIIPVPQRQVGTAVSVIEGPDIELRGYHSLVDVLRTQPGIGVSNSGGHGKTTVLRIRGEEGYRTLLIIDGVKAVDPTGPQVLPGFESLLTTSDLQRVEVLRGPQGFIYGADAGGVVNVLTRMGQGDVNGRVSAEYGSYATRRYEGNVSGGGERADFFASVTDLSTDGFNAQTADTVLRDKDGADNTTWHAKLGWNATDRLRVQLVARDIDASARYDGCFSMTTFETVHDCSATTEQTTYKVSASHVTDAFTNAFGYSEIDIATDNFSEGVSAFATRGKLSRIEYTGSYSASPAVTLVYGLDLQDERMVGDERRQRDQKGYYLEYQGELGSNFFLTAGARYDDNDDFGSHTSLRVSGAYLQAIGSGNELKYRVSYGTGFRPPSLYEVAYNRGPFSFPPAAGFELSEESSRGYDVGVEYFGANGLRLELTWFDQQIDDAIFFDLTNFSGYLQAPGKSTSKGVELAARAPLGTQWEVLGNWTYNDAETPDNAQRLRRPRNLGNVGVLYTAPGEQLRVIANYRVSRDAVDIGSVPLDNYGVLDLSFAYTFSRRLELFARLENLTDEDYEELIGFNTPGRSGYAGVRVRF